MFQLKASGQILAVGLATLVAAFTDPTPTGAQVQDAGSDNRLAIVGADDRLEFQVELALTPEQRSRGLMFRTELAEDEGMLFDFGTPRPVGMWMRNTYIPLDMLFIDADGRITRIEANAEPLSERTISSGGPVRAVLELPGGITEKLGIEPGDRVLHPLFSEPPTSR